ncbi:oligopeptide/dipeptide ABC transporter ATP-binding protein [Mesorhizobium sp. SP-1A]|uniref:ABC transporter ATP-binding protein n=1 Tax=Mesorhizobium sp. SP-1A TaxID=3077840 RepID=UPI0028F6EDF7|nr:oligopeptide/dipeptide ABC transporter ATP-binding protein [Mesorhizobium sp. SP-1A]
MNAIVAGPKAMSAADGAAPLLRVSGLKKHFPIRTGVLQRATSFVKAVDGVDFQIAQGETLGLVGESGCGKSTVSSMLVGLTPPTEGRIEFGGRDITDVDRRSDAQLCRDLQIVFQDPYGSLNRRMRVFDIVAEPLLIHRIASGAKLRTMVLDVLSTVGLNADQAQRYPSQFSGGQRQRIGIARALVLNPKLIVLDEPVSALDVSVQAQILNLLKRLQRQLGLSYLFISHDLSVVRYMAERIAVMYLGKIVETADRDPLFERPAHPYTEALLSSIPSDDPGRRSLSGRIILNGDPPSPANPPSGCAFHKRCFQARDKCPAETPPLSPVAGGNRKAACFFPRNLPAELNQPD